MNIVPGNVEVSVVGLGYVGLPTALSFHEAGFVVNGIDISEEVVSSIKSGNIPFTDGGANLSIPSNSNRWSVTSEFEKPIFNSDIVMITVPTPVNKSKEPDLSYVISASRSVLDSLDRDSTTIITLESTVFPGVTRRELGNICNELSLSLGEQVVLAYSPERVSPGDPLRTVDRVARIVGCDDPVTGEYLADLYSFITSEKSTYVGKIEVAEASKLIENVQRDIDIALCNELSIILPKIGLDVEEVLIAASTKWNFHRHRPGIGVGGHCIPVDPYYYLDLSKKLGKFSELSSAARKINESMPSSSAMEILQILEDSGVKSPKILVMGYSYKPETGDTRETPVLELTNVLSSSGAQVLVWDPFVGNRDFPEWVIPIEDPLEISNLDMVVIATSHNMVKEIDWKGMVENCRDARVYDGRRDLEPSEMESMGWSYFGVGYPRVGFDSRKN